MNICRTKICTPVPGKVSFGVDFKETNLDVILLDLVTEEIHLVPASGTSRAFVHPADLESGSIWCFCWSNREIERGMKKKGMIQNEQVCKLLPNIYTDDIKLVHLYICETCVFVHF